ncbi:mRNA surveillance protein pelota [Candidatus Woesearchaeota archaeon CG10_big_fil_rev_8_21_14_0_10_44_13]|nr:MAG: mRNA surveillance protein pelota [Candidatus Woesearchaeota archaeon CG10_big_fil_rev_8_21_14_0_10_44_13]
MKIIYSDLRKGEVKVNIDSMDDLWYLSNVIEKGDFVKGQTIRKIKLGGEEDRKSDIVKKKVFLKIRVEEIEFHKYSNILRVSGTIAEGPEDISRGSHHTFSLEENTTITIEKASWPNYQVKRLREAAEQKQANILICVMDREDAYFAIMKKFGYEILTSIRGDVQKKSIDTAKGKEFYNEIKEILSQYDKKYVPNSIVVASPAFWKEDFMKAVKDEQLRKKIVLATCSSCDEKAFNEVLKRPELHEVLRQDKAAKEIMLVEELLSEISKDALAVYGFKEVENAVNSGAVKILLITDNFINSLKQTNRYSQANSLLRNAEAMKGEINIISSDHDGGKKLDGLGGIAGILRYRMSY